jgi:hypothetical protein
MSTTVRALRPVPSLPTLLQPDVTLTVTVSAAEHEVLCWLVARRGDGSTPADYIEDWIATELVDEVITRWRAAGSRATRVSDGGAFRSSTEHRRPATSGGARRRSSAVRRS